MANGSKRVLVSVTIKKPGTGYKLWTTVYPDITPPVLRCHALYDAVVQVQEIDANGGIVKVWIEKAGYYDPDCSNNMYDLALIDNVGQGAGAQADISITPLPPEPKQGLNKVTITIE